MPELRNILYLTGLPAHFRPLRHGPPCCPRARALRRDQQAHGKAPAGEGQQAEGLLQALHQPQLGRGRELRHLPRQRQARRRQVRRDRLRHRADEISDRI